MKYRIFSSILSMIFVLTLAGFVSAQNEREEGMKSFKAGIYRDAINSLNSAVKTDKKDAEAWNYLGLAHLNTENLNKARQALEKAVNLSPQNATYRANLAYVYLLERRTSKAQSEIEKAIELNPNDSTAYYIRGTTYLWEKQYEKTISDAEKAIELNKDFANAYILKSDALLFNFGQEWSEEGKAEKPVYLLQSALETLKKCSGKCLNKENSEIIKERLEAVEAFFNYFNFKKDEKSNDAAVSEKTPIKLISKPPVSYTDAARQAGEKGKVGLAVLFGADGTIKHILVLQELGYGLTQQAVAAARKIVFEPEKRNGKPVAKVMRIEYSFSTY